MFTPLRRHGARDRPHAAARRDAITPFDAAALSRHFIEDYGTYLRRFDMLHYYAITSTLFMFH